MADRVVVVGGGILGTMHARAALNRGFDVVQLEADPGPRGASVRNLGLLWVSGRASGRELDLALSARVIWDEVAEETPGVGLRPVGSLTVVRSQPELDLVRALAAAPDAARRELSVLDPAEARAHNPALGGDLAGALLCRRDAVVEPGAALPALRDGLARRDRVYRFVAGRRAVDVTRGGVTDHRGEHYRADLVVVCPGAALNGLGGSIGAALAASPLRRCRLQMLETAPSDIHLTTAVADGDSMRYYPAFDLPERDRMPAPGGEVDRWAMQLLVAQRADGGLTVGDTHEYAEPFPFALDEEVHDRLRARAEHLLGRPLPPTRRRWAGVYSGPMDHSPFVRAEPEPGVVVVTGLAGRGMTLSPAVAEETMEAITT